MTAAKFRPEDDYAPPAWIDLTTWSEYLKMRRVNRQVPTEHACELIVRKLAKWRQAGHDANAILETSIENTWTGVFEPRSLPARKANEVISRLTGRDTQPEFIDVDAREIKRHALG